MPSRCALGFLLGTPLLLALAPLAADDLERARAFYAERPRVERPMAGWQEVPEGLPDLSAETCGFCHSAIYEEWRVSTHGQAWTDRQFQAEIAKSGNRWLCNNCHTPLMNQMEAWAVALDDGDVERPRYAPNSEFDAAFRDEGITCAACHVRDGAVEGPWGVETDAHPTRAAARFLDETICLQCHQAERSYPGKDFICVFQTGDEWRRGPYSDQPCQSCHMQPVSREHADGAPVRSGRHHWWPGAGIYKQAGVGPPLDLLPPGLGLEATASAAELVLEISNRGAGHMLPTGDPERHITVEARFADAAGRSVGASHRTRIGQVWEWYPEPRKLDDNRLAPRERREIVVPKPPGARSWRVEARSHRIGREALEYHELAGYPASRLTHELEGEFATPGTPGE